MYSNIDVIWPFSGIVMIMLDIALVGLVTYTYDMMPYCDFLSVDSVVRMILVRF